MDYKYNAVQKHIKTKTKLNSNALGFNRIIWIITFAFALVSFIVYYLVEICLKHLINTQINLNLVRELALNKQNNDELQIVLKSKNDRTNTLRALNTKYIQFNQLYISLINTITKKKRLINEQRNWLNSNIIKMNKNIEDGENNNNIAKDQLDNLKTEIIKLTNSFCILKHDINVLTEKQRFVLNSNDHHINNSLPVSSKILKANKELIMLHQWIGSKYNLNYELLYRGSACAFSVKVFHLKCDFNTKPLLLLVHTTNNLTIGGFITKSIQGKTMNEDRQAFLFSINNNRKYSINDPLNAFYSGHTFFMYFGQGDLIIYANEIESHFPISYGELFAEIPLSLTNGSNIIKYDEIEAFSVDMSGN